MNHCKNFLTGLSASTLTPSAQCQHRSKRVSQICLNPISNFPFCWQGLWDLAPITLRPLPYRSPLGSLRSSHHGFPAWSHFRTTVLAAPSTWNAAPPRISRHRPVLESVETFFILPSCLTFSRRPILTTLFNTSIYLQPLHSQSWAP